jgi:hypothetical protein
LAYIEAIWETLEDSDNLIFGFISWEDLWSITDIAHASLESRIKSAEITGFTDWLRANYELSEVSALYGREFSSWEEVPIGEISDVTYGLLLQFIDYAWVNQFYIPASSVFPGLSMEVRLDSDPVWRSPGVLDHWHSHEQAWDLPGAGWTTVYWAPPMGGLNQGESLSPEIVIERFTDQMGRLRKVTGNRPIYIDQLLVEDYTPGFEANGRLAPGAMPAFLRQASSLFPQYIAGYALWTWRDYRHDAVPSPDGFLKFESWETTPLKGAGKLPDLDISNHLFRTFDVGEFHAGAALSKANLCIDSASDRESAQMVETLNNELVEVRRVALSGNGRSCLELNLQSRTQLRIEAFSDLTINEINFYGFTQRSGIRDVGGSAKPILAQWKRFNQDLAPYSPKPFSAFKDGWMGKSLTHRGRTIGGGAPKNLEFRTSVGGAWPFEPQLSIEINGATLGTFPCLPNGQFSVPIGSLPETDEPYEISITVDRTYRPKGDQRLLGCIVKDIELTGTLSAAPR